MSSQVSLSDYGFFLVSLNDDHYLVLEERGQWQGVSLTNAILSYDLVAQLAIYYEGLQTFKAILYCDSSGIYDQIVINDQDKLINISSIGAEKLSDAIAKFN